VPVERGPHMVRFEFAPLTWEVGWRVSAATWAILLTLAARRPVAAAARRFLRRRRSVGTVVPTPAAGTAAPSLSPRERLGVRAPRQRD
jgi:hypothetical protein